MHSNINSNHRYQSLPPAFLKCHNLSGTYSPCVSWQHLFSQQVTAWQFIRGSNYTNLTKCMLVSSVWTEVADATLKQICIINATAWYCLVECIPFRWLTGRIRQGEARLLVHTILFRGKIFMPHLPEESLQCGSDYIAAFGLKSPKPLCCCVNMFCLIW